MNSCKYLDSFKACFENVIIVELMRDKAEKKSWAPI